MSENDINRWKAAITPRDPSKPWVIGSGGSWDLFEVQPISDELLDELARRYHYSGTPWNCRSIPLSQADREYMFLIYYGMQGLVARMRRAEADREAAAGELARAREALSNMPVQNPVAKEYESEDDTMPLYAARPLPTPETLRRLGQHERLCHGIAERAPALESNAEDETGA